MNGYLLKFSNFNLKYCKKLQTIKILHPELQFQKKNFNFDKDFHKKKKDNHSQLRIQQKLNVKSLDDANFENFDQDSIGISQPNLNTFFRADKKGLSWPS